MQAANDIAQAVAEPVEAEQQLEQAKATEKQAFTAAVKKGWTQAERNRIGAPTRRRPRKKADETTQQPTAKRPHSNGLALASSSPKK